MGSINIYMKNKINQKYNTLKPFLDSIIYNYDTLGTNYGNQNRNSLKLFDFEDNVLNIKSFKIPNIVNRITYRFFRKSKAQRSYEYACKLQSLDIGTPQPIGYYEYQSLFFFNKSYYISEHLNYQLTFRELTTNFNYPDHENILRAFTRFTFELHEKGVHFLDHSPGNTLIKKNEKGFYNFYLVDLNRMEFKQLDFDTRMKNFARLTREKSIIRIMANEYASLLNSSEKDTFKKMWFYAYDFQNTYLRKRKFKKKIMFWKT